MKTKIRITESGTQNGYKHLVIDILEPRYKGARYLEPIGHISFQMTVGDEKQEWYGMKFIIETDNEDYIEKMAKLAKFIKKNRTGYNSQPDEIKLIIGAEEHIYLDSEFIPVSDKGKNIYKVIRDGSLYDKITATNEIIAQKILDKQKIRGAELKFHKVIQF